MMSDQPLLQALRELAIEKAARKELEKQTVLKTRQLWQLREQQEKEVQQYQEQLTVLRSSLILAHKQQHQQVQHADPYHNSHQASPEPRQQPLSAGVRSQQDPSTGDPEDASPTKADQRKAAARQFTPDSTQKQKLSHQQQQQGDVAQGLEGHGQVCAASPATPAAGKGSPGSTPAPDAGQTAAGGLDSTQQPGQTMHNEGQQQQQQQVVALETAEQLLAAASKVQQLVEHLSAREPSAAADLSVLQWQLTAIYGMLTCTSSSSNEGGTAGCGTGTCADISNCSTALQDQRHGVLQGVSCTGSDPLSATCSPAAVDVNAQNGSSSAAAAAAVHVDATTGTSPVREPAAAAGQPDSQQQLEHMQELSRTAAAAQLFSGAANSSGSGGGSKLAAASLCWFYLEPGDPPIVKGHYDAGLMLRWYLGGFLTDALRIAGVVQSSSSSSCRAPPDSLDDFQPLGQLLQQVQQGQGYTPARAGKEQPLLPSPARRSNSASKLSRQSSQLQAHFVGMGLGGVGEGTEGGSPGGAGTGGCEGGESGILAKGGSILTDTVGYWLDMAASAQLPGPLSLVQLLDKVVRQAEAWD